MHHRDECKRIGVCLYGCLVVVFDFFYFRVDLLSCLLVFVFLPLFMTLVVSECVFPV